MLVSVYDGMTTGCVIDSLSLSLSIGVAQARVHALYGVLDEYEKGKSKMQLHEIESHDDQ